MNHQNHTCPACGTVDADVLLKIVDMPANVGGLWPDAASAQNCPRGDMILCHCSTCQLLFNASFEAEPLEYSIAYDNSLEASTVFHQFATGLADQLIDRYDLRRKKVIEIGCGKGAFIKLLCERGNNYGVGFDTTYDATTPNPMPDRLSFVKAHYSEEQTGGGADLIACRHVLEHIPDPQAFLSMLRRSLDPYPETVVYFEVPEVMLIVDKGSIWDLVYEHCTYFGHEALAALFARSGFEILRLDNHFDDQFLSIEARPATKPTQPFATDEAARVGPRAAAFAESFRSLENEWRQRISTLEGQGRRIAVWAAGAKTVSFMNMFQLNDQIESVVDINPRKQGKHLPGTGHLIEPPSALKESRPDVVIVMNPHYTNEIRVDLDEMGLAPELIPAS